MAMFIGQSTFAQNSIEGSWNTGKHNTVVETYLKDGAYFGKVKSSEKPKAKIGIDILRDLQLIEGKWKGKLYIPKRDRLVDAVVEPSNNELNISISSGVMKRTLVWTRKVEE